MSKPRNPLVVPALLRKAGVHGKTPGAIRQASRREVSEQLEKVAGTETPEKDSG